MISMEPETARKDNEKDGKECVFPFFAWQCLTLHISGSSQARCVDLVIKDRDDMNRILNFFVMELNTVDGTRNSAQFYIDASVIYEIARQERKMNRKIMIMRKARPPL